MLIKMKFSNRIQDYDGGCNDCVCVYVAQGVMFYVPHWLWKKSEGGLFKVIMQDLSISDYLGSDLKNYSGRTER